jgi:hypothetical protein
MGRPSGFSQEVADAICEALIEGKSLRSICLAEDMPSKATVCRWLAGNEAFRDQYTHAREFQADTLFDESLDIADERNNDLTQPDLVQRARLRIDTRKWMAGKLRPQKYGEKLDVNHSGNLKVETVKRVIHDPRNPDSPDIQPTP